MVMNDNDSSWVGQRAQEMLGSIEAEYTRSSILFKPTLRRCTGGWQALYPGFMAIFGKSPDEAMRNFDRAWPTIIEE